MGIVVEQRKELLLPARHIVMQYRDCATHTCSHWGLITSLLHYAVLLEYSLSLLRCRVVKWLDCIILQYMKWNGRRAMCPPPVLIVYVLVVDMF